MSGMVVWADLESYCEIPISHGHHAYVEKVEVIISQWAIDDGPVRVEEGLHPDFLAACDAADMVVFHNAPFDTTVLKAVGHPLPMAKVHCTLAQARSHSLPGGLGDLCTVLGVDTDKAKDKAGKTLIQLFCKPRPKNQELRRATKHTHPIEWARFMDYARLDIEAMRACYKKMPKWNYGTATPGNMAPSEREVWLLDQKINNRGMMVDLPLADAAIKAVTAAKDELSKRTDDMTYGNVQAATQRDAMLAHILSFYGVDLPDMQKGTLERRIEDPGLPEPVRELLRIRLEASTNATAKYKALVKSVSSDGRLSGTLSYCGAARTGRWSGKTFQPQNLARPKYDRDTLEDFITALKLGVHDLTFDDVLGHCSSAVRGCIIAPPKKKLVVSDLANIEGRLAAWLAGEDWKVKAFADYDAGTGHDLYVLAYARAFGLTPEAVIENKKSGDGLMRQIGKVMELALGYGGAVGAFISMAAIYGVELSEEQVISIVKAWRKANPRIVRFWYDLEAGIMKAIRAKGTTIEIGRLRIRCDGAWLKVVLPSDRALVYPNPRIITGGECVACKGTGKTKKGEECPRCEGHGKDREDRSRIAYSGIDQYSRKWGRIDTWGGKAFENAIQALARDVLAYGMIGAENAGYELILTCHDEVVTETPDTDDYSHHGLSRIIATKPPWAEGLPLAAEGFEGHRYGKV